jgi:hypothetical protein
MSDLTIKYTTICNIISDVMERLGYKDPEDWLHIRSGDDAAWAVCEQLGIFEPLESRCSSQPIIVNSPAYFAITGAVFLALGTDQLRP